MPQHKVIKALGMTQDCFLLMWCNFHIYDEEDMDVKDGILEFMCDHDEQDQEDDAESGEEESDEEDRVEEKKIKKVVSTRNAHQMKKSLYCGGSLETHQMKNKPIGEGYKSFTLATVNGYVLHFTPDGCTAAKSQQQEYTTCSDMGKTESVILHVISIIEYICCCQDGLCLTAVSKSLA
eukprot:2107602-Ditylum_brightwellii.AAC.1